MRLARPSLSKRIGCAPLVLTPAFALIVAGCIDLVIPEPASKALVCRPELREEFYALSSHDERFDLWAVFIDVGQGDATWIRTPGTVGVDAAEILVDAGDDGRPFAPHVPDGAAAVLTLMRTAGFSPGRRLDVLAITHPDKDHYGGAAAVLDAYRVNRYLDPGRPADGSTWQALEAAVAAEPDLTRLRPAAESGLDGWGGRRTPTWGRDVDVSLLSADAHALDDNSASLVLELRYRGVTLMLLGDAEATLDERLIDARRDDGAWPPLGPADIVRVGHHGGHDTSTESLLDTLLPFDGRRRYAIVSAGNRHGLPSPDTLARLEERVGPDGLLRTDRGDADKTRREAVDGDHILLRVSGRDGAIDLCYLEPADTG